MRFHLGEWFNRRFGSSKWEESPLEGVPVSEREVRPPWVEYPGPGEFFWREAGQPWKANIWEPYYNALSPEQQDTYLKKWQVPDDWWDGYFDPEWRAFWDRIDD